ncbi:MAG TPA: serine hydrolase domain-containing protein [Candidatus Sulfotelmatobacter sp.]|nr:serine hydrolase domain-containing protein [Candidatus Sulfotelmatobacter sp.]
MATRPEAVGFSSTRLQVLADAFQRQIDEGGIAGALALVARNDRIAWTTCLGWQNRAKRLPMRPDAIFRLASMTKPLTSVAVMLLAEEGRIDIGAPAALYLPEFADLKVGVERIDAATGKPALALEPLRRPMTVQDLLRHTSGLTYGQFGRSLVKQATVAANVMAPDQTLAEFVARLARLPLAYQPGTTWDYGVSTDVLGRIVEVVSGRDFDRFLAERVTGPLGMADTAFHLDAAQLDRLAEPLQPGGTPSSSRDFSQRPRWCSGGGGLASTIADYARFCRMLLNGGVLDGVRLLSPRTVAFMTADHLGRELARDPQICAMMTDLAPAVEMGQGFGLGFAVRTEAGRNPAPGSVGNYFWQGSTGPYFWIDPAERMFAILMLQVDFAKLDPTRRLMRQLVYQALVG